MNTNTHRGYQKGRIDGYQLGKERGLAKALEDQTKVQSTVRVLIITASPIVSLEIGILQPFRLLQKRGDCDFLVKYTGEVSKEDIMSVSTIIFLRTVEAEAFQYLIWAHELGKQTIYYIDDHFLALEPDTRLGFYYSEPEYLQNYIRFLKYAHQVKVDSQYFGEYIQAHYNPKVCYFPGSVDFSLLNSLERRTKDDQMIIGYAGGNKEKDFEPVVPALKEILEYYGGFIRLEFFGFTPAELAGYSNVVSMGNEPDYRNFIQRLYVLNWDIGLAPLEDSQFNYCKTNNKFREYSACGIPGVYSHLPTYSSWVEHGENGYLARHSKASWSEALVHAIENKSVRNQMQIKVEKLAKEQFPVESCADHWMNQLLHKEE